MSTQFESLDINSVRSALEHLYEQVARGKGRVEVTRGSTADGDDGETCVLISKTELQCLERALEILAATDGCKEMRQLVAQVVSQSVRADEELVATT